MHPFEILAGQIEWAGRNMAHNLDFIPDDKLNWKPGETASSALELAHHACYVVRAFQAIMDEEAVPQQPMPADRESAKTLIHDITTGYAAWVRRVEPSRFDNVVKQRYFGEMPLRRMVNLPVFDFIHHHGQIVYIQTLLGDTESHFSPI